MNSELVLHVGERIRLHESVPGLGLRAGMAGTVRGVLSVGVHAYYDVEVRDSILADTVRALFHRDQLGAEPKAAPAAGNNVLQADSGSPASPRQSC